MFQNLLVGATLVALGMAAYAVQDTSIETAAQSGCDSGDCLCSFGGCATSASALAATTTGGSEGECSMSCCAEKSVELAAATTECSDAQCEKACCQNEELAEATTAE